MRWTHETLYRSAFSRLFCAIIFLFNGAGTIGLVPSCQLYLTTVRMCVCATKVNGHMVSGCIASDTVGDLFKIEGNHSILQ